MEKFSIVDTNIPVLNELYKEFSDGNYNWVLKQQVACDLLNALQENSASELVNSFLASTDGDYSEMRLFLLGVSALEIFVQNNWTGPTTPPQEPTEAWDLACLSLDGETAYSLLQVPELFLLARLILVDNLHRLPGSVTAAWWSMRALRIHQLLLPELSQTLHDALLSLITTGIKWESVPADASTLWKLKIEFYIEVSQIYLMYHQTTKAQEYIKLAQTEAGLQVSLTGILGKRTKFQVTDVAQLVVKVSKTGKQTQLQQINHIPKDVLLDHETLLDKMNLKEDNQLPVLCSEEQAIVLAVMSYVRKAGPMDELIDEELMSYVRLILEQPQCWSIQSAALVLRSQLESNRPKTVQRSLVQLQELVDQYARPEPPGACRLKLFYCTQCLPRWELENRLAHVLIKLGALNSALEIFSRLELWDDAISCYHHLGRRHNAEEIVRSRLVGRETEPIMWCQLGDCTDDTEHYNKAWELSNHRCGRAKRSLGQLYFSKKLYSECILPYQECLKLNTLQPEIWFRLGYAAMTTEQWDISAKAYRNCVTIDQDNFEAWNNLSRVYIQTKQLVHAWKALQEALRCNFHSWKIWENYMVVSTDIGAFNDAISAYHHIMDEKEKFIDEQVLGILVGAIVGKLPDMEGQPAGKLYPKILKLLGRITSQVASSSMVWKLYADLYENIENPSTEDKEKVIQYRQKAQRAAVQKPAWAGEMDDCITVLQRTVEMTLAVTRVEERRSELVASTRMMINSVLANIKQHQSKTGCEPTDDVIVLINQLQELLLELQTPS